MLQTEPVLILPNGSDKEIWYVRPDGTFCISEITVTNEGTELIEEL